MFQRSSYDIERYSMENAEVLQKIGSLKPSTISDILEVSNFLGIPDFSEVTTAMGRFRQTVIVTCVNGRKYLFGLGRYGFVEIVRADSKDGEIIYVPEE